MIEKTEDNKRKNIQKNHLNVSCNERGEDEARWAKRISFWILIPQFIQFLDASFITHRRIYPSCYVSQWPGARNHRLAIGRSAARCSLNLHTHSGSYSLLSRPKYTYIQWPGARGHRLAIGRFAARCSSDLHCVVHAFAKAMRRNSCIEFSAEKDHSNPSPLRSTLPHACNPANRSARSPISHWSICSTV